MCCIIGTRVIQIPHTHIVLLRKPKPKPVYPQEIVEIECPADAEITFPIYV